MKNPITLFLVLSLFFAISCKKKNAEASTTATILPLVPQKVDGYIDVFYEYQMFKDSSKFRQSEIFAKFYSQAQNNDPINYFPFDADVGNITLNDSTLGKWINGSVTEYYCYPALSSEVEQIKKARVWQISGNGSFKKMSVIDNTPLPELFGAILPDTMFKPATNSIKLGNYTGIEPIQVIVKFPSAPTRIKIPTRSAKEIIFTESDFASFFDFETVNVTIKFTLINSSYQTVEGKVLCLTSHISYETYEIPFKF